MPTFGEMLDAVAVLQEKLHSTNPNHRLVSFLQLHEENQREMCRINLISSFCSNNERPLVHDEDLSEALSNYLAALQKEVEDNGVN